MLKSIVDLRPTAALPFLLMAIAVAGCPNTTESTPSGSSGQASTSSVSSGGSSSVGSSVTSTSSANSTGNGGGGATSSTGNGGGGATSSTGNGGSSSSTGGGPTYTVGGLVHFLQSGTVVLKNGADMVSVMANGSFDFPNKVAAGAAYAVTVSSSPAGQECWVQNGSGTVAAADVSNIDVRCTTILQSLTPVPGTSQSTSSATLVPIPDIAPITFTNDIPANVLATLQIPSLASTGATYYLALDLDGTIIDTENQSSATAFQGVAGIVPGVNVAVHSVAAGMHTLTPMWWGYMGSAPVVEPSNQFTSEMDLVVLESLPSFDQVFTSTLAGNAGMTDLVPPAAELVPMGFSPLNINIAGGAQPAFASLRANDFAGDRVAASLTLDDQPLSGSIEGYNAGGRNVMSYSPMQVTQLLPGAHTFDGQWFSLGDATQTSNRGIHGLASYLNAVLFKSGTLSASSALLTPFAITMPASFTLIDPKLQISLTLPKASKVLVTFDAFNIQPASFTGSDDIAIFVNGVQGRTLHAVSPVGSDQWSCQGGSMVGIVEAPAGVVTIEARHRKGADNVNGTMLHLDNMVGATQSADSKAGISAVVLD